MAGSFNFIQIAGYLGRDPETRTMPSGDKVTVFSVATDEKRSGQEERITTWFRISTFGKLAETAQQYLHKGSYVYVQGSLSENKYTDREGNPRTSNEVRARDMKMLDRAPGQGDGHDAESDRPQTHVQPRASAAAVDDDTPFHHLEDATPWQLEF